MQWFKLGPNRREPVGLEDRNLEYAKIEDRTGSIRSDLGLDLMQFLESKNKLYNGRF